MSSGIFPDQLKLAKVVPVYKSGDSDSCNNYRPISVLQVFSKVFERIIHKRLYNFLHVMVYYILVNMVSEVSFHHIWQC